jgi:YHS domain-containing protein
MRRYALPAMILFVATLVWGANVALAGGAGCQHASGAGCQYSSETGHQHMTGAGCHASEAHCGNITKTNAQGEEVAICACGMEFAVTKDTPVVEHEGKRYFLCSDSCTEKVKADPAAMVPVIEQKLAEIRKAQGISGNVYAIDAEGNKVAVCTCGAEMKVTGATVKRDLNGESYYFCCDNCAATFDKDPAGQAKKITEKVCDLRHAETKQI